MRYSYGPTRDLHTELMYLLWCPIIDALIIMATFSSYRLAVFVHIIGAFIVSVFSIMISLPILATSGLVDKQLKPEKHNHMLMGLACLALIVVQLILGALSRIANIFPTNSAVVINFHKAHKILGICLVLSAKITTWQFLQEHDRQVLVIVLEVPLIAFYLYRQFFRSKLQEFNRFHQLKSSEERDLRKVGSLQEIVKKETSSLVIFQNYIYELEPLREWHPAGYQIVESVKNSEIDKFIYGMEPAYSFPMINPQSHSKLALKLLDSPIAKLSIKSCYQNLLESTQVTIKDVRLITKKGQIYQMYLQSKHPLNFNKYTQIKQLGRHYSLTLNQSTTRLYTNVNFLNFDNIQFLSRHLTGREVKEYFQDRLNYSSEVPILFKHYKNGKMTSFLVNKTAKKIQLSCEKGLGMQLDTIMSGKVIIIAGGTGIYPFSDLIDHIYKLKLLQYNYFLQKEICQLNPLLLQNHFTRFRFKIMAAFSCIEEIHPVTFEQLSFLAKQSQDVEIILRIQQDWSYKNFNRIRTVNDRFQSLLANDLQDPQLAKIFVCGPQRMNQSLHKLLKQNISSDKFMIM